MPSASVTARGAESVQASHGFPPFVWENTAVCGQLRFRAGAGRADHILGRPESVMDFVLSGFFVVGGAVESRYN